MVPVAIMALVAGAGMIGIWTLLLATGQVPELRSRDRAIWFHLAAEYGFGAALVVAGVLLLVAPDRTYVRLLAVAALGGMTYSCVNSPGYYARDGKWAAVAGFGALALAGAGGIAYIAVEGF